FDGDGQQRINFGLYDYAGSVAIDSHDRIVVAGFTNDYGPTGSNFAVARLNPDGALDTSFDGDGQQTIDFGNIYEYGYAVTVDAQDRILVAGESYGSSQDVLDVFAVARLATTGALDISFGDGGRQTVGFAGSAGAYGVAVDSLGRVVLGGVAYDP